MARAKKSKRLKVKGRKYATRSDRSVWVKRSLSIMVLLVALISILFLTFKGFGWVHDQFYAENPRYEIQHLIIESNGSSCSMNNIREWSGLSEGMNLFSFTLDEIEARLLPVSNIESVYLERELPNTFIIQVKERHPVARLSQKKGVRYPYLIDRFGVVMPYRTSALSLPFIVGFKEEFRPGMRLSHPDISHALEIISLCDQSAHYSELIEINQIDLTYRDYLKLLINRETQVRLPRYRIQRKLQDMAAVIQIERGKGKRIKSIDLTVDSKPIIRHHTD